MLTKEIIEAIVKRYVDNKENIAIGTFEASPQIIDEFSKQIEEKGISVFFIPTSTENALLLKEKNLKTKSIDKAEIDLAIEYADQIDFDFNYIKNNSLSLVRDKMIAKGAKELVVVAEEENYKKQMEGKVAVEITPFAWKKTIDYLSGLGKAELRTIKGAPFKTETGHYIVDLEFDPIYTLEELDYFSKDIPGVLETGFFIDYCDKILLTTKQGKIKIKSRRDDKKESFSIPLFKNKPV